MGATVSFARNFGEYPGGWMLCYLLFRKSNIMNITETPEEGKESALSVKQGRSSNGYEISITITSTLNGIMMALRQSHINKLGVYGSSNVRKANLVEKVSRRIKRDNLFDVVVMASVTKKPDMERIQEELGSMLGLQFNEETIVGRASRLCERIKKEEKILIILDDLWGGINLGRIGIPSENDHKGCKILLISQSQEVLSDQMNTVIEFSV